MPILPAIGRAFELAFFMFWEVLWPLALGILLSAIVQTVVSRQAVAAVLGKRSLRGIAAASGLGAASSSCSYAAVALGRSLFRKGADFGNAIIFEFASTNLVLELGLVLLVLLGWQFVGAEFAGGFLMIGILAVAFKYTLKPHMVEQAREQAAKDLVGRMEGHAEMDMSMGDGSFFQRLFSGRAFTAIAHYFWMDAYGIWQDLGLGFLIAGALAAWVPNSFWRALFLTNHPMLSEFWGPLIGPLIALSSFVCSVGNVPLAAVLWSGGISFGGVIAFIFGDLIIIPILDIYRKYYGGRMTLYLLGTSYLAMGLAGFLISLLFQLVGLAPAHHAVAVLQARPEWNYTTLLNFSALLLMAVVGWRFLTTGGVQMLRMMEAAPAKRGTMATDPVCGMTVDPASAERSNQNSRVYYFCSAGCRQAFEKQPERYCHKESAPTP